MIELKDEHYYTATMIEKGKREFVVFEYRCNTFHVTGRTPFSLDQKFVEFENVRPIGSKKFLARDS